MAICEICKRSFQNEIGLKMHKVRSHKGFALVKDRSVNKSNCCKPSGDASFLADQVHNVKSDTVSIVAMRDKWTICPVCDKLCNGRSGLRVHELNAHTLPLNSNTDRESKNLTA